MGLQLSSDQIELQARAFEAGSKLRNEVADWDRTNKVPYQRVVDHIAEYGLLGLAMPKKYGGQGLSTMDYFLVVEALFRSAQFWVVGEPVFATTGPGPTMLLLAEQERTREKFLPDIVQGKRQCAIALTEPDHGSDLTSLTTSARRTVTASSSTARRAMSPARSLTTSTPCSPDSTVCRDTRASVPCSSNRARQDSPSTPVPTSWAAAAFRTAT